MDQKVRWGVLGVARIATEKVIPAMQRGAHSEVIAIASRDLARAKAAAAEAGIPKAYGSYEELIADPDIEAIYNPLPNQLHLSWSTRAAEAGKHVLCEKPITMTVAECRAMIAMRDRTGVKIGEAFMVRTHPQLLRARELVRSGEIGELRAIQSAFSYCLLDPENIRNRMDCGGGGLMDIGCYPIQISRFLFGCEPVRVVGMMDRDPVMGTDRLTSGMLEFPSGQSVFTCGTQHVPYQRVQIFGTRGRIEIQVPFNPPPGRAARLFTDTGADLFGSAIRTEEFPLCDQYTIQGDLFSEAVRGRAEVPTSLENALGNMAVIEGMVRSAREGCWVRL
jgi:predicted dehydrogenase